MKWLILHHLMAAHFTVSSNSQVEAVHHLDHLSDLLEDLEDLVDLVDLVGLVGPAGNMAALEVSKAEFQVVRHLALHHQNLKLMFTTSADLAVLVV